PPPSPLFPYTTLFRSEPVDEETELERVLPVIRGLVDGGATAQISIDTSKAAVAAEALGAGATLVNDVTALRGDPEVARLLAERGDRKSTRLNSSHRTI